MKEVATDVAGEMFGRMMSEVVMPVLGAAAIAAAVIYLVPSIIALFRRHKKFIKIFLLNLLLGWTVIGWIWALIWALGVKKKSKGRRKRKK